MKSRYSDNVTKYLESAPVNYWHIFLFVESKKVNMYFGKFLVLMHISSKIYSLFCCFSTRQETIGTWYWWYLVHLTCELSWKLPSKSSRVESIDFIKVLVNVMHSGRLGYFWEFKRMDIPITQFSSKIHSNLWGTPIDQNA